jgi:hypothetical protein
MVWVPCLAQGSILRILRRSWWFLNLELTLEQIASGQISLLQLFRRIMAGSVEPEKLFCYIEVNVSGLVIESTENPYIYLHRSVIDLSISNLIIRSGETLQ